MFHTYVNFQKELLIEVDLRNGFKERIRTWLEINHNNLFMDIDCYNACDVTVTPDTITISGDDGLIILDRVDVKEV